MEGTSCYDSLSCDSEGLEPPIFEYELYVDGVCSVTGGYVYRGNEILSLYGKYVYGDWCTGDIWALTYSEDGDAVNEHLFRSDVNITSFGLDQHDELLICANGKVYKLVSDEEAAMGDLNQDGLVNVLDVVSLVNIVLGNSDPVPGADLNGDGQFNVLDVVLLVNLILSD